VVRSSLESDRVDGAVVDDGILESQPNHFDVREDIGMGMLRAPVDNDREFLGVLVAVVSPMPMVPFGMKVVMLGIGGHKGSFKVKS